MTDAVAEALPAEAARGNGPGAGLRAARERRALTIAAVAESLHVETRIVEAMEADRFAVFDAPVYARGFLRKYADFLEQPVAEVLAGYERLAGGPVTPTLIPVATAAALPRDFSPLKPIAAVVVGLAVLGGGYAWWQSRVRAPRPAAASTASIAVAPTLDERAADAAAPVAAQPEVALPRPQAAPASVPRAPAVAAQAAAPVVAAPRPAAAPAGALVIQGVKECWVEVYTPTGARAFFDLVRAGESRTIPGPGPWRVFLGYAEGVRLNVGRRTVNVPAARRAGVTARFVVAGDGAAQ